MRKALQPPLRTRRCLLLPYQVLASVSRSCPSRMGRFPTCYSPVRHSPPKWFVRLACIRHAASVHPEPGSNSPFDIDSFLCFCSFFFSGVSQEIDVIFFLSFLYDSYFISIKFSKIVPWAVFSTARLYYFSFPFQSRRNFIFFLLFRKGRRRCPQRSLIIPLLP